MREERYHIALDKYDRRILLNALNTLRNQQMTENRPTDPVDNLILKVSDASQKKVKRIPCPCNDER